MENELSTPSEPTDVITAFFEPDWAEMEPTFGHLRRHLLSTWFPAVGLREGRPGFVSAVDIEDMGDVYELRMDLPGFSKEQIDVRVQGSLVHVKAADAAAGEPPKTGTYLRRERASRSFERSFELPERVVADHVNARYQDGVLTVTVPKVHPAAELKVKID